MRRRRNHLCRTEIAAPFREHLAERCASFDHRREHRGRDC